MWEAGLWTDSDRRGEQVPRRVDEGEWPFLGGEADRRLTPSQEKAHKGRAGRRKEIIYANT